MLSWNSVSVLSGSSSLRQGEGGSGVAERDASVLQRLYAKVLQVVLQARGLSGRDLVDSGVSSSGRSGGGKSGSDKRDDKSGSGKYDKSGSDKRDDKSGSGKNGGGKSGNDRRDDGCANDRENGRKDAPAVEPASTDVRTDLPSNLPTEREHWFTMDVARDGVLVRRVRRAVRGAGAGRHVRLLVWAEGGGLCVRGREGQGMRYGKGKRVLLECWHLRIEPL